MKKHRTTLLMTVLLCLAGYYVYQTQAPVQSYARTSTQQQQKPLDGENRLRIVSVKPGKYGEYKVAVEYRFRGGEKGAIRAYSLVRADAPRPERVWGTGLLRGEHKFDVRLGRDPTNGFAHSTRFVRVEMYAFPNNRVIASSDIEYPIDWPRRNFPSTAAEDMAKDVHTLYREAVSEIDYGNKHTLDNARKKLEIILGKDPKFVPAYPEMARYHMKTNWGPEGMRQGERLLETGLAIDPNHASSYVLLGYVYAHQRRYQKAEEAFRKASEIGTDNLWLWANWGELRLMQGKLEESIAMYRKAINAERPYNTYDRAQTDAYRHLINIYTLNRNIAAADALYLKRIEEFPRDKCYPYYYARFRERHFDDADVVLTYAKKALTAGCSEASGVRQVMGIGYYLKWAAAEAPEARQSYLTQARLYFPEGPMLIYSLAQADRTAPVIERLVSEGISVDVSDNDGLTALAYAIRDDDFDALKRLIDMGGDPNAAIGREKLPLLAVAVLSGSEKSVTYLVARGADVNAQVGGVSIVELAESMGYPKIVEALKNRSGARI